MISTAESRTRAARVPILKGCLWYDPRLAMMWQCQRVFGQPDDPSSCVIHVTGFIWDTEANSLKQTSTYKSLEKFVDTCLYFGTVHHTTWDQADEA